MQEIPGGAWLDFRGKKKRDRTSRAAALQLEAVFAIF
jgi:hypothetical protein